MATLRIEGSELQIELSTLEKLGALSRGVRVPLSSVSSVRVSQKPWRELRGLRVGTAVPFVVLLGRMYYRGGADFVAMYGNRPTAIVELRDGAPFKRLFVTDAAPSVVDQLRAAAGRAS